MFALWAKNLNKFCYRENLRHLINDSEPNENFSNKNTMDVNKVTRKISRDSAQPTKLIKWITNSIDRVTTAVMWELKSQQFG